MRKDYQDAIDASFDVQNTQGININAKPEERLNENYTSKDKNWNLCNHAGDIYISVPDSTHNLIVNHHFDPTNPEYFLPEKGYPGVSGFFADEVTASQYFTEDGKFDSIGLGQALQQAPHFDDDSYEAAKQAGESYFPEYNGHLDCFRVNPDKMQEHFGTTDFYAAMSTCAENIAWGDGGGRQGYNSFVNEMINKEALEYIPQDSKTCDFNKCVDYYKHKSQANEQAKAVDDYIKSKNIKGKTGQRLGYNEIPHSNELNGTVNSNARYRLTETSINGGGSQAPPIPEKQGSTANNSTAISGELPPVKQPATNETSQISGTLPDQAQNIDLPNNQSNGKSGLSFAENAKKNSDSFDTNNIIS